MRKNYALFIIFLISLLQISQDSYSQGSSQKLVLTPSMVTNESAYGDAGMLFDEQPLANDPLNGAGGAPQTNWFPGWGDKNPASAYIDLGANYDLSHIFIYDTNGVGDFIVEYGEPGNWVPAFTEDLIGYLTWKKHDVTISTRYLRFTRVSGGSNAHEIVLYGSVVTGSVPVLEITADQTIVEEGELSLPISATDPDNGSLAYSLTTTAEFITLSDNNDGTATLNITPPTGSAGVYSVTIAVASSTGGQTTASFDLTVESSAPENPPSSGSLQVIGIDFHDWRNSTPSNWNSLSHRAVGGTVSSLKNQSAQNTSYSITVTDDFNGTGLSGLSTGNNSGPVPDGVMSTFWFNQHNQGILKFVLDKTKKYTFRIYGGRDGTADDKSADYTIGDQTVSLYNFNNIADVAVIENVIPDDNNEVFLSVRSSVGYSYAILNGIVIEEYAGATNEGEVPDHLEYQALVELYNSTGGANWTNNTNWLQGITSADISNWYGLEVENGDIVSISLAINNIEGTIPESIVGLKELTYLDLSFNNLEGNIPVNIGSLSKLSYLLLDYNNLHGSIPQSIGDLLILKELDLGVNKLSNAIPNSITKLSNLYSLDLYGNELTGSIPKDIGNLSSLNILYLHYNPLDGVIPNSITRLQKLKRLIIGSSLLTGNIPENIGNLRSLIQLEINRTEVSGSIPESIGNLSNLKTLNLIENNLTGPIPESITNLDLETLQLSHNSLTGNLPINIGHMTSLKYLMLHYNSLTGTIPEGIGNLAQLKRIYLNDNLFSGISSSIIKLSNLTNLNLSNNRINILPNLKDHPNKENLYIYIDDNQIDFDGIETNMIGKNTHPFKYFSYNPQAPPPPQAIAAVHGSNLTLTSDDNAPHNNYQWQKNINGAWTDIVGATAISYTIPSVTVAGQYRCRHINDWVPNLWVYSKTFEVEVEERLIATPPADLVQNRPTDETGP